MIEDVMIRLFQPVVAQGAMLGVPLSEILLEGNFLYEEFDFSKPDEVLLNFMRVTVRNPTDNVVEQAHAIIDMISLYNKAVVYLHNKDGVDDLMAYTRGYIVGAQLVPDLEPLQMGPLKAYAAGETEGRTLGVLTDWRTLANSIPS